VQRHLRREVLGRIGIDAWFTACFSDKELHGELAAEVIKLRMPFAKLPQRILDPMDRISEVLFGLIVALTFTCTLGVATADNGCWP
jgi:hypothetical protein